jgi:hypothetical protein
MYTTPKRSYQQNTFGVLIQNTWTIHPGSKPKQECAKITKQISQN